MDADPDAHEPSATTFSSLVEAMSRDTQESNGYVAIARWVKKDKQNKGPEMYALFPVISEFAPQYSLRCVQLAFREQLRYRSTTNAPNFATGKYQHSLLRVCVRKIVCVLVLFVHSDVQGGGFSQAMHRVCGLGRVACVGGAGRGDEGADRADDAA